MYIVFNKDSNPFNLISQTILSCSFFIFIKIAMKLLFLIMKTLFNSSKLFNMNLIQIDHFIYLIIFDKILMNYLSILTYYSIIKFFLFMLF